MLYDTECWVVKNQHENQVSVVEMKMLCWMSDILEGMRFRITPLKRVRVTPIVEKVIENRLKWFEHVERGVGDVVVQRVDHMKESKIKRGRGRPIKTLRETIGKY